MRNNSLVVTWNSCVRLPLSKLVVRWSKIQVTAERTTIFREKELQFISSVSFCDSVFEGSSVSYDSFREKLKWDNTILFHWPDKRFRFRSLNKTYVEGRSIAKCVSRGGQPSAYISAISWIAPIETMQYICGYMKY